MKTMTIKPYSRKALTKAEKHEIEKSLCVVNGIINIMSGYDFGELRRSLAVLDRFKDSLATKAKV